MYHYVLLPQLNFILNLNNSLARAASGAGSRLKMASSHSLQRNWIKGNRIKDTAHYTIALSKLFNKSAARHVGYFKNLYFKLFVRIHPHLVHILQAIEAAAAESTTHHGSKTPVTLH